jgi:hypothetical protein
MFRGDDCNHRKYHEKPFSLIKKWKNKSSVLVTTTIILFTKKGI